MREELHPAEPVDCQFVVEKDRDNNYAIGLYDIYRDEDQFRAGVVKNLPWPMTDKATAHTIAGVISNPILFLHACSWTQEKWEEVIGKVREQLEQRKKNASHDQNQAPDQVP